MDMIVVPPSAAVDKGSNAAPPPGVGSGGTASNSWIVVTQNAIVGTLALDLAAYPTYATVIFDTAMAANITTFQIANAADGQSIIWRVKQDATGSRTWAPNSSIGFSATIPSVTLSTGANKQDYIAFRWNSTAAKAQVTAYNLGF